MAESRGSVVQMFRMLYDRTAAAQTEKEAQATLAKGTDPKKAQANIKEVGSSLNELKDIAKRVGEAIIAAFAIEKIREFFTKAIEAAAEYEHSMHRVQVAVENAGASFEAMRPQIQGNIDALAAHSRFTRTELLGALGTLITITGDVNKSMNVMQVVTDLSVQAQLDLGKSAQLVARYLTGQDNALSRYIGRLKEGENGIDHLRQRMGGAAEHEMNSYEGRLISITKAKQDLLRTVGELILGETNFGQTLGATQNIFTSLTKVVLDNKEAIITVVDAVVNLIGTFARLTIEAMPAVVEGFGHILKALLPFVDEVKVLGSWWELLNTPINSASDFVQALKEHETRVKSIHSEWQATADAIDQATRNMKPLNEAQKAAADHTSEMAAAFGGNKGEGKPVRIVSDRDPNKIEAEYKRKISVLAEAAAADETFTDAEKQLRNMQADLRQQLGQTNLSEEERIRLGQHLVMVTDAIEKGEAKLMERSKLRLLAIEADMDAGRATQGMLEALGTEEKRLQAIIDDGTMTIKTRTDAQKELNEAIKKQADLEFQIEQQQQFMNPKQPNPYTRGPTAESIRAQMGPNGIGEREDSEGRTPQQIADIEEYGKVIGVLLDGIDENATKVAESIYDAFYNSLNHITLSFKGLGQAVAGILKGTAKAILKELQEEAKGQAIHDAAAAIQQLAWGLARSAVGDSAGAALHYASAKTYALSAAEWGGAALAEGALLGGSGTSSGGGAGSLTNGTGGDTQANQPARGQIHIYLDGVDPLNPRHQELIGEANKRFGDTGGYDVIYHPGRRSA
jgi:hypothetical protein